MALGFAHDGERRAFERFREELTPQGWVIAHNLYVARREERGAHTHELDLLLLHPQRGMVMVEVKCGRVERTAERVVVHFGVAFQGKFAGKKQMYAIAMDGNGAGKGLEPGGTFLVSVAK